MIMQAGRSDMKNYFLVLFLLLVIACSLPSKFDGVKWETSMVFPLLNDTYYASDLIKSDPESFDSTAAGAMYMRFSNQLSHAESNTIVASDMLIDDENSVEDIPLVINVNKTSAIPLKDSDARFSFSSGVVASGHLNITAIYLPDTVHLWSNATVTFPEIFTPSGAVFVAPLNPETTYSSVDLSGYAIRSENQLFLDSLQVQVQANGDVINVVGAVSISIPSLAFQMIRGKIYNKEIKVTDNEEKIDMEYPDNIQHTLLLKDAKAHFSIYNDIGFNLLLNGILVAINENTDDPPVSIPLTNIFFAAAREEAGVSLSTHTIDITPLMQIAPTLFRVQDISFRVSEDSVGFASIGASAWGEVLGKLFFRVAVNESSFRPVEPHVLNISADNQDYLDEYISRGQLQMTVLNKFPLAAAVNVYFCKTPDDIYTMSETINEQGFVLKNSPLIAGEGGAGGTPSTNELGINLSAEHLKFFQRDSLFYALEFDFPASSDSVEVLAGDYAQVKGRISCTVLIDTEAK